MDITKHPRLSVVVPTHEMEDREFFFKRLLESLWNQSFQDFEIVVTDNSEDDTIKGICEWYKTGIRYYRNPRKGMAPNTNEGIRLSKGQIVKILYMDDYLLHDDVLDMTIKKFNTGAKWVIAGANNNYNPHWTDDVYSGNNKLGSPSALAFVNKDPLLFDETLTWLLDCDIYKRLHDKYGDPVCMHGKHIGIGEGLHQATHLISDDRKLSEYHYLVQKHA